MYKTVLSIVAILLITGFAPPLEAGAKDIAISTRVIYSGNLDGELEPCGCSEAGDLGGILRRASKIAELRKQWPQLFLISSGGLLANASPRDRLKSEYILKGFSAMRYDAVGLQWRDLSYGSAFLDAAPLPWTASNWNGDGVPHQRDIRHGEVEMAFFAWLTPEDSPFRKMKGSHRMLFDLKAVDILITKSAYEEYGKPHSAAEQRSRRPVPERVV